MYFGFGEGNKKRILKSFVFHIFILNRISNDLSDTLFILCLRLDLKKKKSEEEREKKKASMGNDWLRQRKEIKIRPREEAEASKDSDKQINRKGRSI